MRTALFLGYCAASSGNILPKFRYNLSVPSSTRPLKMGPIGCPQISLRDYHYSLHNNPEERSSFILCGGSLKSHKLPIEMQRSFL